MGCCYWFLILFSATIAFLVVLPPPKNVELGKFTPGQPTNLEQLNIPLNRLQGARYIDTKVRGPEDIQIDNNGFLYTGLSDGSLLKINIKTEQLQKIGQFQGPILGLAMSPNQKQLALATQGGLALVNLKDKSSKILVSEYNGIKFASLNSITFVGQNKLYFTVSGSISMKVFHEQVLYRLGDGQIFSYDILSKQLKLQVSNIAFANGIAYSQKQNCLYMNELNNHRILRYSLAKQNYMKQSVVLDNIFGYLDNIKITSDGYLWIGIPSLRDHVTNLVQGNTWVRNIILNLRIPVQIFMSVSNMNYSGGIKVDPINGQIVQYLFGKPDSIYFVTAINQKNGKIFMSSLMCSKIAVIENRAALDSDRAQKRPEQL